MLPFYKNASPHPTELATGQSSQVNLGLFFNRFFNWSTFDQESRPFKINFEKDRSTFLKQFAKENYGCRKQIGRFIQRQMLLNNQQPSRCQAMKSDWHWVTGLGNNHPLENGFSWHHTLSMPYLPGSSVKGLVRAYCELQQLPAQRLKQWFGSEHKDPTQNETDTQAGELVFFDAIPCGPADILPDTMTPHSGDWLQEGSKGQTAPADWHDPIPISFLVCRNLTLLFSVAKASHSAMPDAELDEVMQMLQEALGYLGAGAKTAVGYGTMSESSDGMEKAKKARDERLKEIASETADRKAKSVFAKLTENEQVIHTLQRELEDQSKNDIAMATIKSLIDNKGAADWPLEDRLKLVEMLKTSRYLKITNKEKLIFRKTALAALVQP